MDEVEVAIYKKSTRNNGMSSSTYSHYDSGICPEPIFPNRNAHSSPEEGDLPVSMPRSSFTIPLKNHSNGVFHPKEPNGCCSYTVTRNGRTPPGIMLASSSKQAFNEDYAPAFHRTATLRSPEDPIIPLPKNVLPIHYDLILDVREFSTGQHIHGNISILFESFGNSTEDEIVFHAASNIFIHRLRIRHDGKPIGIKTVKRQFKRDLVKVQLKEKLKATWYTLEIEFRTKICQSTLEGAQCMKMLVPNSTTEAIVGFTTKFEPTFARTFLPCWDEPGIKTTFNISIKHPKNLTVLTNSAIQDASKSELRNRSEEATYYQPIPKMPIYLLAFVVGDFIPLEMRTDRNMPLTLWTSKEDVASAQFAANFSPVMFDRAEEEFGVLYPISKMDFIAVPGFPVGGMENWGLVIYNDRNILMPSSFIHVRTLETVEDIDKMFDELQLYTKGAVVVKMIKDLLGSFDFRAGISRYLKKNSYKSVTKEILWSSLPTYADHGAENEKLSDVMESWLMNEGMPEVLISRNYEDHTIRITQRVSDQNRYIIYLNDATFKAERPKQETRTKRSASDEIIEKIEEDDYLVNNLDQENEKLELAAKSNLSNSFFESLHLGPNKIKSVERSIQSEEMVFDDSLFYVESTSPIPSKESVPIPHSKKHSMRTSKLNLKGKSKEKELKVNAYVESVEMSAGKIDEFSENKIPLFTKRVQHEKKPNTKLQQQLQSGDHFSVESEFHRKQIRRRIHSSPSTWSIPFSYWFGSAQSSSGQTVRQFWVHNETIRFVDVELSADEFILANPHWVYPFKVNYDLDNWKMLIEQLHRNPEEIATMSRAQLIVDSETYLKQSGVPYLYAKLLHYLNKETDLGVLLIGLDAVHSLIDMFSATNANGPLLVYFSPVFQQFDAMLERTSSDPEVAAVWLLSPQRLAKLYQLRCLANFGSCQQNQQVQQWLAFPTALSAEQHQQVTAICHYLFTQGGPKEVTLLAGLLRQRTTQWPVILQLATCVRDEILIEEAVTRIVKSRNAAVYATVLQGSYSIQYNRKFREVFWKGIASLSLHERQLLFAVNTGKSDRIAQLLLHSVRGSEELEAVVQLLPEWPSTLQIHIDYIRRKFAWIEKTAVRQIQNFLIQESA
ncbi:hypothetical protein FO519_002972 [Halicephalobus sp. NKZ332]|nr:hypothetical protein FO519_002972 [Halicephalobus sp. NKZ332]